MFSVQIETLDPDVLHAFARMFNELATLGRTAPVEMTATQYIDKLDAPDVGKDTAQKLQPTTTAAAIFGSTLAVTQPSNVTTEQIENALANDAAAIFGANPLPNVNSCAPFTAGAEASLIAPVVTPGISTSGTVAPPPAPPREAVAQTAAVQIPPTSPVLLDSEGMPWDVRIHAGTRTQTQKGVWKAKKGVDDTTVAAVTAELKAVLALPPAAPFVPLNAAPPPPPAAASIVAAPPPPPAVPTAGAIPTDFATLCRYVTGRQIPAATILQVCNKHGLAGLGLLALKPDLVGPMYADFAAL